MMKPIAIIFLSLALAGCSACNRTPPPQSAGPGQATVTVEGNKVITTTKDPVTGKIVTVISQPSPPDNYPKDIPAFPEGMESAYSYTPEVEHITFQSYSVRATREVGDYFEHELSASGWTANVTTGQDKVSTVKGDKAGRHVEIEVSPYSTGSKIMLSYNVSK